MNRDPNAESDAEHIPTAPPATRQRPAQGEARAPISPFALAWAAARASFGAALLAATGSIALMLLARAFFQIVTPAELLGDRLTALIPLGVFSALLTFFGHDAKHYYFAGVLVAQGLATAALVCAYWAARAAWHARRQATKPTAGFDVLPPAPTYRDALALAALYWVVSAGIIAPLIGAGPFGSRVNGGVLALLESEIIPALATGLCFVWLFTFFLTRRATAAPAASGPQLSRRRALRQVGFGVAVLLGTAAVWEVIARVAATFGATRPALQVGNAPSQVAPPTPQYDGWQNSPGLVPEVTPTPRFYYVSKNLDGDPNLDTNAWQLTISGMVNAPQTLTYDQLRALSAQQRFQTLECISNDVGGNLMSNAQWTGTSLAQLLTQAGIQAGANEVIFHCADGYSDRLHLSQALDVRALIVYDLNGAPLPAAHGFPARLLVPGLYGMKNGKWLTGLEVAAGNYQGYWEQQGWSQEARVKLMSRIDVPSDGDLLGRKPLIIGGVAFSGDQGIGRVEVTTDGGATWTAAQLKQPLSALTWVLWEWPWTPAPGTHVLAVRATDLAGNVQSPLSDPPLPDGASGYHAITVTIS